MTYKFSLPIEVSYIIDDNELQILELEDLEDLEEKYNVDLQYIIDEYEYKLEAEQTMLYEEDEDYFSINKTELLHTVINDNLNILMDKFNNDFKLKHLNKDDVDNIVKYTKEDFNNQIFNYDLDCDFNITSLKINDYNLEESKLIIDVDVDRELDNKELNDLKFLIDKNCIDQWGENFESIDLSDVIDEDMMYVYLKISSVESQLEHINI